MKIWGLKDFAPIRSQLEVGNQSRSLETKRSNLARDLNLDQIIYY